MVAVMATVLLMGGWLGGMVLQFANQIFQNFYKWK
jgi:type III secretory pathway component EscS